MVKRKYQEVKWMKGGKRSLIYEDDEGKNGGSVKVMKMEWLR